MAKKPREAVCDSHCNGCVFKGYFNGNTLALCEYFLKTGKRRPCPAGDGCTVKETGSRLSRWHAEDRATWKKRKPKQQRTKPRPKEEKNLVVLEKECLYCGAIFHTTNKRQCYCSDRCKNRVCQKAYRQRQKARKEQDGEKEKGHYGSQRHPADPTDADAAAC